MEVPKPVEWLARANSDAARAFLELRKSVKKGARIDSRVARLCLAAAYAAIGCAECLAGCLAEGLKEGLELEEMLEACSVAVLASGGRAVMTVYRALEILEKIRSEAGKH